METVIRSSIYACELHVAADVRCNVGKAACSGYAPVRSVPLSGGTVANSGKPAFILLRPTAA